MLLGFGLCWCWTKLPSASPRSIAPLELPQRWPLRLHLQLTAGSKASLDRLLPPELALETAAALRAALRPRPGTSCASTWKVRVDSAVNDGGGVGTASQIQLRSAHQLRLLVQLREGPMEQRSRGRLALLAGTEATDADASLIAADANAVASWLVNGSTSLIGSVGAALHEQLHTRSCSLAKSPTPPSGAMVEPAGGTSWRPPFRVALVLLQAETPSPALAARRRVRLIALREQLQRLLEAWWPDSQLTPQVHSQVAHFVDLRLGSTRPTTDPRVLDEQTVAHMLRCGAGAACGRVTAPSVMGEPSLQLLLYAPTAAEKPMRLRDRRGRMLPVGSIFVLQDTGGLSMWLEAAVKAADGTAAGEEAAGGEAGGASATETALESFRSNATSLRTVAADRGESDESYESGSETDRLLGASIVAQLRQLVGLPVRPPVARYSDHDGSLASLGLAKRGAVSADASALEATSLQMSCARAAFDALQVEMAALRHLEAAHGYAARFEGHDLSSAAALADHAMRLAHRATRSVHGSRYIDACAEASAAQAAARAAAHHPALLPTSYFSEDHTLSVYAPLFLPIASAVGGAIAHSMRLRWVGGAKQPGT